MLLTLAKWSPQKNALKAPASAATGRKERDAQSNNRIWL
jgi:hypothetical protein